MTLFINACVRKQSRTKRLAEHLLSAGNESYVELDLNAIEFPIVDEDFLIMSFPASLKQYIEQINVTGITFSYTPEGVPFGLCKARRLTYITTVGGNYFPEEFGAGYIEALSQNFYGIPEFELIKATGLDIEGADVDEIINTAKKEIKRVNN